MATLRLGAQVLVPADRVAGYRAASGQVERGETAMRLSDGEAWARLEAHDHGTLCTVHPRRGVDAVPCLYAMIGETVGFGVDRVKPKPSGPLQRERNLRRDPRAALLIEHWDREEWSRLWWVRAELRLDPSPGEEHADAVAERLAERFPEYREQPFHRIVVLRVVAVTGWAARG